MRGLPGPPPVFARRKERILAQLAVPDAEYSDASPKGSVDAGIRGLIGEINALDGFVTTSSCAGRVSVFVEGRKAGVAGEKEGEEQGEGAGAGAGERDPGTLAAVGGKGGGGTWLFVSHDPLVGLAEADSGAGDVRALFGLRDASDADEMETTTPGDVRLIHFKFEPMILHVLTASLEHAQLLLRCGLQAGFRESGAVNVAATTNSAESVTPIVAIRSMGLSLESLIGVQEDGVAKGTVSVRYLRELVRIANERFEENRKRIERFRAAILEASGPPKKRDGTEWEDAQARRERKRAEGLRRKAELQGLGREDTAGVENVDLELPSNTNFT
ncbi:methyltransferase TYW3-domain-containing protein [Xylaria sp. CBS 124048]|nr:methyltransferase TYW3-domain-containing protein [Xylaria sp. CBS 124048]